MSTLDRIVAAYADAVAAGDFAAAEGWLATAWFVAERATERERDRGHRILAGIRSGSSRSAQ